MKDAEHILTQAAMLPLRIGAHAAGAGVYNTLHFGERMLATTVKVGESIERPALAAVRAAAAATIDARHASQSVHPGEKTNVHHHFFAGVMPEILNPGGALPGANQWDRPLSKDHPNPVILVHGTAGGAQTNWGSYVPLLVQEGFSPFTLTFGAIKTAPWPLSALGGMAPIEDSAAEFGTFVDKVLAATRAERVDVIGHSQGTIIPAYYAKFLGGADKIHKHISLAPLWQGTEVLTKVLSNKIGSPVELTFALEIAHRVRFASAEQMAYGSEFMSKLNSLDGPYVPGIRYVNITTRYDEFIRPYTSGLVPPGPNHDVINVVVQDTCHHDYSDHLAIAASRRAATMALNALEGSDDPARGPREVPDEVVPPFVG